eukprot:9457525-Alexandrium_andersonii.AAC.1
MQARPDSRCTCAARASRILASTTHVVLKSLLPLRLRGAKGPRAGARLDGAACLSPCAGSSRPR